MVLFHDCRAERKVAKGEANFTIGAYSMSKERNQILSPSDPILYVEVGFIYKSQHKQLSAIKNVLTPFNSSVWLTLLLITCLSIFIIIMTKLFTKKWRHFVIGGRMNRAPILNAWASVLGHSVHNPLIINGRSFGNFARTLTKHWIILWFIVRSYYEGTLYNNMQGYQSSPYDTVEKVLASNCQVIVPPNERNINMPHFFSMEIGKFKLCDIFSL